MLKGAGGLILRALINVCVVMGRVLTHEAVQALMKHVLNCLPPLSYLVKYATKIDCGF